MTISNLVALRFLVICETLASLFGIIKLMHVELSEQPFYRSLLVCENQPCQL